MKIAYVYDLIHPYVAGGAQKRIWELSRRLVHRGHQVTVFGMKHWEGNDIVYSEGVRLWGVCPSQELFVSGHRSIREAMYFACRVLPPLMKERYDVVDTVNFPFFPCFSAALHSLTRRSRLIITWHEIWDDYWYEYLGSKGLFGKAIERLVVHLPHKAIAVSQTTKRELGRLGRSQAEIVPNGADIRMIELALPSPQLYDIVYVGRLTKEKNLALLIGAVNLIKEQRSDISCLIVGDGPEKARLHQLVHNTGLEANVHFKGPLEQDSEVFSHMKSARVLALPSLREGFGIVVIEANACGIPVVTVSHHQNAAQDLINDGYNGFVCSLSEEGMAQKLLLALDGGNDWAERCKRFAGGYDWNIIADAVERVYKAAK